MPKFSAKASKISVVCLSLNDNLQRIHSAQNGDLQGGAERIPIQGEGATHGAPTFPQQAVNQMKLDAAAQYWVRSNNHTHADDDM